MPPLKVERGDIFWVRLDPTEGHEQQKTRPCVVVSNNTLHPLELAIILPLSSTQKKNLKRHQINLREADKIQEPSTNGCPGDSLVLTNQIRVVSLSRFDNVRVARVIPTAMAQIEAGLVYVLDILI